MSADNWAVCPQCRAELNVEPEYTLREDYEFWIDETLMIVHANYSCRCTECGYKHAFQHESAMPAIKGGQGG
jgi:hypothetical protein